MVMILENGFGHIILISCPNFYDILTLWPSSVPFLPLLYCSSMAFGAPPPPLVLLKLHPGSRALL